MSLLKSRIY